LGWLLTGVGANQNNLLGPNLVFNIAQLQKNLAALVPIAL
jgi:hypothetical protein